MKKKKTVSDMSGFNFIKNPFKKATTIFECFDGIFICNTPEPDDRCKHQIVLREATKEESDHHNNRTIKIHGTTWQIKIESKTEDK